MINLLVRHQCQSHRTRTSPARPRWQTQMRTLPRCHFASIRVLWLSRSVHTVHVHRKIQALVHMPKRFAGHLMRCRYLLGIPVRPKHQILKQCQRKRMRQPCTQNFPSFRAIQTAALNHMMLSIRPVQPRRRIIHRQTVGPNYTVIDDCPSLRSVHVCAFYTRSGHRKLFITAPVRPKDHSFARMDGNGPRLCQLIRCNRRAQLPIQRCHLDAPRPPNPTRTAIRAPNQ